jgi:hypothetical protein
VKAKTASRQASRLAISQQPINPGVIWVAAEDREVLLHGRIVLELCAARGSRKAGIPFQNHLSLLALHTGPYREFQEIKRIAECVVSNRIASPVHRIWVGQEGFNFLSSEGLRAATMRYFPKSVEPMCTSIHQPLSAQPLPQTVNAIASMQPEIKGMGHLALIFSSWPAASADQILLRSAVDELVTLERCEPEPDTLLSFNVKLSGGDLLGRFSAGSVMVDVHVVDDYIRYRFRPFVSKQLLDRYIWMLRAAGRSLDAIGAEVGLNKSTVKRRLDRLPPPAKAPATDGWEAAFRAALEVGFKDAA